MKVLEEFLSNEHVRPHVFFSQLLQFQSAGLFTMGTTARPCAQFHHSLSEKHMRKVLQSYDIDVWEEFVSFILSAIDLYETVFPVLL